MRNGTAQKRKKHSLYVKRRNKKVKTAFLVGSSVVLLAVFFLVKSFIVPAVSAFSSESNNLKDKDIYSIIFVEKGENNIIKTAKLLVAQKSDNKLYSINIPTSTIVDLPGRLGEEEYGKILEISMSMDQNNNSAGLLVESTKKLLKINVDRYAISTTLAFNSIDNAVFEKDVSLILPWEFKKTAAQTDTNLSVGEALDFVNFARGLNARDVTEIDLGQVADMNLIIRDLSLNGEVAQESLGVVILNGTGVGNAAKETSQVFQNMGARISLISNAENEYEKSYLVTDNPLSATARYIKSYYPNINIVSKSSAASLGEDSLDRGDICVIVGFDILEQLE